MNFLRCFLNLLLTRPYPIRQLIAEVGVFLFCGGHHVEGYGVADVFALLTFFVVEFLAGHVYIALGCGVELWSPTTRRNRPSAVNEQQFKDYNSYFQLCQIFWATPTVASTLPPFLLRQTGCFKSFA